MEQIENFFVPDAATDEPAVIPATPDAERDEHPPAWLYWQGVADGIRRCGGIVPPQVLAEAGLGPDQDGQTDDGRDLLDFEPVQLRARTDGWTPRKQRQFIEELADCGIIRRAAAAVGMSEQAVTRLRRRADARAFDAACDAAQRFGARRLQSIAWERAIEGTVKRHYYHGELKSEERVFSERLLVYLLGRTRHLDQASPESERVLQDWEGSMTAIEQGQPIPGTAETPAGPSECENGEDEFDGAEVWERDGMWVTDFPPPEGFDGYESGEWGSSLRYYRELTDAERTVIEADEAEETAERLTEAAARRDRYFGFDAEEDSASLSAVPSTPSELSAPLPAAGREGLGVGAAEALGGLQQYRLDDAVGIVDHFGVPEAYHCPAPTDEEAGSNLVTDGIDMLSAVDLDNQLRPPAGEIDDVGRDRELASKPRPIEPEHLPQNPLAVGSVGPQVTSP